MPFPHGLTADHMLPERLADDLRTGGASADEAHPTADQPLDRRHANLGLEAPGDHFAFVERKQDCPAYDLAPRLAAATASLALE